MYLLYATWIECVYRGLDSRAAQVVMRCISRVASTGRTVVCTIHQPSQEIFSAFDSLLLLRRGGETVYFGNLGEDAELLVRYMQGIPGVRPLQHRENPATWMLENIGAGTAGHESCTDFHAYYNASLLREANDQYIEMLCESAPVNGESDDDKSRCIPSFMSFGNGDSPDGSKNNGDRKYNANYTTQFWLLLNRGAISYWRAPGYNFVRMVISVMIALIFAITYVDQQYSTDIETVARVSVIYMTLLFIGNTVMCSHLQAKVYNCVSCVDVCRYHSDDYCSTHCFRRSCNLLSRARLQDV